MIKMNYTPMIKIAPLNVEIIKKASDQNHSWKNKTNNLWNTIKVIDDIVIKMEPDLEINDINSNPNDDFNDQEANITDQIVEYHIPKPLEGSQRINGKINQTEHNKTYRKNLKKMYACELCKLQFDRSYQLKRHMFIGIHSFEIPRSPENHTDNSISETDNPEHEESIKDEDKPKTNAESFERVYCCEFCNDVFTDLYLFDEHLQVHNGNETNVKCELCDQSFDCSSILKNHVISHVFNKPFKCKMCEKSFSTLTLLNQHLRFHLDVNNKVFKCTHCKKVLLNYELWMSHLYVHNGIKPFNCKQCLSCAFIHICCLKTHVALDHN